jgi:hypothetical protein
MKMIKIILAFFILCPIYAYSAQKAVTDTGDIVVLNDDGTWVYSDDTQRKFGEIITNSLQFTKPKNSSFLLKSTKNNSAFWINMDKWTFKKGDGDTAEYEFQLKGSDLYGMAVTEAIGMPIENLADIALQNAKDVAPNAKIVEKEYRYVNGTKLLFMQLNGTIQGIKFAYLGYYHSDAIGSTQFLAYTGINLVPNYKSDIEDFLNGFTMQ